MYGAERCEKGSGVPSILGLFEDRDEDRDEDGGGEKDAEGPWGATSSGLEVLSRKTEDQTAVRRNQELKIRQVYPPIRG